MTVRKIEAVVKKYGLQAITGAVASLGLMFRESLIDIVSSAPQETLATTIVWLSIFLFCSIAVSGIYILKSRSLEKAILKIEPDFYRNEEFETAFNEATKDK